MIVARRAVRIGAALALAALIAGAGCGGEERGGSLPLLVFGGTGRGAREFSYPRAAAWAAGGPLFVVDKGGRIQAFDAQGAFVRDWRVPEVYAGKPTGLGAAGGRLYVADTHYSRVLIYDFEGRLVGQFGRHGDGPGEFRLPTDVAVDREGFIYVSEYGGNDRVSRFTPDLEWALSFGGPESGAARLSRPQGLCCDPDGSIWVADACNHRICRFDADGRLLSSFGGLGSEPGRLRFPYNVERLSDGTLVVCEYGNNRVQRFDRTGRSLGVWGAAGRDPGELAYPWALAATEEDRLFIVDSGNNRVQVVDARDRRCWRRPAAPRDD